MQDSILNSTSRSNSETPYGVRPDPSLRRLDSPIGLDPVEGTKKGSQQVWHLKFSDPSAQRSFGLRFSVLSSGNGFKRIAEAWAFFFTNEKPSQNLAIKQTHPIEAFESAPSQWIQSTWIRPEWIKVDECELSETHTKGVIRSKGNVIRWDLKFIQDIPSSIQLIPSLLSKTGLFNNTIVTDHEDLLFTGMTQINQTTYNWKEAPGMMGRFSGTKNSHSWVWAQCNTFINESGKPTQFLFEGLTARNQVGPFLTPNISSFYFHYKGENYTFNSLKDALFLKSKNNLNKWEFQADRGDLSFRGTVEAEHRNFLGVTYEDTNGSLLYSSSTHLAQLKILVYKKGKLEATLLAPNSAALEIVKREKNPYVPITV
jgi:hypothetical protein